MKFNALKDFNVTELLSKGRDLRQELFNLRLQKATAQIENTSRLNILRKDIARIETRITQLRVQSKAA